MKNIKLKYPGKILENQSLVLSFAQLCPAAVTAAIASQCLLSSCLTAPGCLCEAETVE